jgi:hypothetical protein
MELTSNRFYGIEIECKGITMAAASAALGDVGIPCVIQGYNHHANTNWKIVPDGSVYGGFEVVSPKLSGNDGLSQVRKVSEALIRAGARIERDCGFHVHVDALDLNSFTLYNIVKRYAAAENQIDAFMPASRRGNSNSYCRTAANFLSLIHWPANGAVTPRDLLRRLTQDDRYHKVNLMAYLRHGTVEFRQHSGTINANKMIPWIIFCVNFVENSIVSVTEVPVVETSTSTERSEYPIPPWVANLRANSVERKLHTIARTLLGSDRYNVVTYDQLARALGCRVDSLSGYISQFRDAHPDYDVVTRRGRGYYLNIVSEEVRVRFLQFIGYPSTEWPRARASHAEPVVNYRITEPEERGIFHGLTTEVISYFAERTEDLSAR